MATILLGRVGDWYGIHYGLAALDIMAQIVAGDEHENHVENLCETYWRVRSRTQPMAKIFLKLGIGVVLVPA